MMIYYWIRKCFAWVDYLSFTEIKCLPIVYCLCEMLSVVMTSYLSTFQSPNNNTQCIQKALLPTVKILLQEMNSTVYMHPISENIRITRLSLIPLNFQTAKTQPLTHNPEKAEVIKQRTVRTVKCSVINCKGTHGRAMRLNEQWFQHLQPGPPHQAVEPRLNAVVLKL